MALVSILSAPLNNTFSPLRIDTGIYTAHTSFAGRASWGATFGGYGNADGNG